VEGRSDDEITAAVKPQGIETLLPVPRIGEFRRNHEATVPADHRRVHKRQPQALGRSVISYHLHIAASLR
jgi:hypothetical protein